MNPRGGGGLLLPHSQLRSSGGIPIAAEPQMSRPRALTGLGQCPGRKSVPVTP